MLPIDQRTADHQKAKEQTVLFVPRRGRFKIEDSNTAKCLQSILGEVLHDELTVPARNLISEGPVLFGVLHKSLPALLWNRLKHSETTNPCCPNSTWSEPINTYLLPYLFYICSMTFSTPHPWHQLCDFPKGTVHSVGSGGQPVSEYMASWEIHYTWIFEWKNHLQKCFLLVATFDSWKLP